MDDIVETYNIPIKDLRLWNNNPRYSLEPTIIIDEIGKKDFDLGNSIIKKDLYLEHYPSYVRKLLINKDSISKTLDLIESLKKDGFDRTKDQIFVVKPKFLGRFSAENQNLKNVYYVVEGNRRLMCLDLLLDYNESRGAIEELIRDKLNNKSLLKSKNQIEDCELEIFGLLKILEVAKYNEYFPNRVIPCEVMNFDYYTTEKGVENLNEMLNGKHFGERKGKLNWPRGLILAKIFNKIREYKEVHKNETIKDSDVLNLLDRYMGKKITIADVHASMRLYKSYHVWNKKEPIDKIWIYFYKYTMFFYQASLKDAFYFPR